MNAKYVSYAVVIADTGGSSIIMAHNIFVLISQIHIQTQVTNVIGTVQIINGCSKYFHYNFIRIFPTGD